MNRKTKLVLLISLFSLVCLAILWGRWFPDNREQDTLDVSYQSPDPSSDQQVPELHIPPPGTTTIDFGHAQPRVVHLGGPPRAAAPPSSAPPPAAGSGGAASVPQDPGTRTDPQAGWRQYEIQDDDRLWKIAARFLGDGRRFDEILSANEGLDAQRLRAGRVIRIPPRDLDTTSPPPAVTPRQDGPAPASSPGRRTYKVRSGDSLARIARTQMGGEKHWRKLADANGIAAPYVLQLGQVLNIPQ